MELSQSKNTFRTKIVFGDIFPYQNGKMYSHKKGTQIFFHLAISYSIFGWYGHSHRQCSSQEGKGEVELQEGISLIIISEE
jgi:hypothetical protein